MRGGLSKFHYSFWSEGGEQIGALDFPSGFPLTRNPAKIHVVPDSRGDFVRLRVGSRGFSIERRRQTTRIWGEDDWIFVMSDGTKTLATARIEGGGATFLVEWNGQILIWARIGSATDYELRGGAQLLASLRQTTRFLALKRTFRLEIERDLPREIAFFAFFLTVNRAYR